MKYITLVRTVRHSQYSETMPANQYAVIGAGVFGAWIAYSLRRGGHDVLLVDQYGPANSRASSGGESRIIRAAYGPDEVYTRMAARSLELWPELFARTGADLLHRIGVLWLLRPNDPRLEQSRAALHKVGIHFEDLSAEDLRRRYPQMRLEPDTIALLEPHSGALMARQAVAAVVEQFVRDGGSYRHAAVEPLGERTGNLESIQTLDGSSIAAGAYVFACGPWLGKVLPAVVGGRIFPTRQEVLFFGLQPGDRRFEAPQMPIWLDYADARGMYGFPDLERRGFKLACDVHGPAFDPDSGDRVVSAETIEAALSYLKERFPALANAPLVDSRVCQYENTSNGDLILDRHPDLENVWIAGGGSGHGFKHGPAVGEYMAARVTGAAAPAVEPRFLLASKGTQKNRSIY